MTIQRLNEISLKIYKTTCKFFYMVTIKIQSYCIYDFGNESLSRSLSKSIFAKKVFLQRM